MISLEHLIDALGAKRNGSQWMALCPAHDDRNTPSLAIRQVDGKILLHCHAGCEQDALLTILKARGIWENGATPKMGDALEAEYTYRDAEGNAVGIKRRYRSEGGKTFKWAVPDHDDCKGLSEHKLKIEDMPLYGIERLTGIEEFVLLVEGEKAADACYERGIVALCNPGGSGQKEFGASLEALRGQSVALWPDNDTTGRQLMYRLKIKLSGIAESVRVIAPQLPEKGDAWDYFVAEGHTKEDLLALLATVRTKPWLESEDGDYQVHIPESGGVVHFRISGLDPWGRGHECEVGVWTEIPGLPSDCFQARLKLQSLSGRDSFRRQLEDVTPLGKGVWGRLLNTAVQMVQERHRNADPSINLCDVEADTDLKYMLHPWIVEDGPNILFGQGGSGKTYLALAMAVSLMTGAPFLGVEAEQRGRVLFIDYEASERRLKSRLLRVKNGLGIGQEIIRDLIYWPGIAPLPDMVPGLKRWVAANDVSLIIVDSAILACGGPPTDPEVAAAYFNALRQLGRPSLTISHVVKDQEGDKFPFGSIVWHNSARLTWNVKVQQEEGDSIVHVGLFNRKGNDDKRHASQGVRLEFGEDDIRIVREDVLNNFAKEIGGAKAQILAALKREPKCARCIAEELELEGDTVRVRLYDLQKKGRAITTSRLCPVHNITIWSLK